MLNAPGPVLLGEDVHEDLGLVVDHVDCSVFLSHFEVGRHCRAVAESTLGLEFVH